MRYTVFYMIQEKSDIMYNDLLGVVPSITNHKEEYHRKPKTLRDKVASTIVYFLARAADVLFQTRYGHRAVVLETIAAVPGMVGGLLQHLKSLRFIRDDRGWIRTLLDEAENERVHLIVYSEIAKPTGFERMLVVVVQFFFYHLYFLLYLLSPRTAHRVVGYLEEEAVRSYEHYLYLVHEGVHENIPATELAKSYWSLSPDARLSDMIQATIKDECLHRDVNHAFANDAQGVHMWR